MDPKHPSIDGLIQEKKDLTKPYNDETGLKESHLSHTRVIGDRSYTVKLSPTRRAPAMSAPAVESQLRGFLLYCEENCLSVSQEEKDFYDFLRERLQDSTSTQTPMEPRPGNPVPRVFTMLNPSN